MTLASGVVRTVCTLPSQQLLGGTLPAGFFVDEPQVLPEGRWLACPSDESGRREVFIEPFRRVGTDARAAQLVHRESSTLPTTRTDLFPVPLAPTSVR